MDKHADPWTYTSLDVKKAYHSLKTEKDLDILLENIGDSRCVLLGEASHGTHEFYAWRSAITKRLIKEKGFSFVAVEGDWPDCYGINRYVKGYENGGENAIEVLKRFERWPTWMWANWEIVSLTEWLKAYNDDAEPGKKAGFYGLDVYSLWESLHHITKFLKSKDTESVEFAMSAFKCFEPYGEEAQFYAQASQSPLRGCEQEVVDLLKEIRNNIHKIDGDKEEVFSAKQNARVIANAEKYYRSMIKFGPDSWNIRDNHMANTLNELLDYHGTDSKAIVWAHNTHVGDASATSMKENGMTNLGQLLREEHKNNNVFTVGFGSYKGKVIAGDSWGAPMKVMPVPAAKPGSVEDMLHRDSNEDKLFFTDDPIIRDTFQKQKGHRAIGVVYRPEREAGNYVPTQLASRYDAFIFIDQTKALHPLHSKPSGEKIPETYPFSF